MNHNLKVLRRLDAGMTSNIMWKCMGFLFMVFEDVAHFFVQ